MVVRKLEEKDIEAAVALNKQLWEHHAVLFEDCFLPLNEMKARKKYIDMLKDNDAIVVVAENTAGELVGILEGRKVVVSYLKKANVAKVDELVVAKGQRGQGIGQELMNAFFDICRRENMHEIRVGVYEKNVIAKKFYEDYGFEVLELGLTKKI